ncbi:MAG: hypothetical protein KIT33_15110 [Candidatus Kapabacteria bacterium]|nr:hypothetical protein [Ignavibacteriota bacterium]MCW5886299.1 hypothetical protein [Candidatus Kapabacteria bacterium]
MDLDDKILEHVTEDDLPSEMKYFSAFIGLENVKKLMKIAGGTSQSIPQPTTFKYLALRRIIEKKNRRIDNLTKIKLCREFNIHEKSFDKIMKER